MAVFTLIGLVWSRVDVKSFKHVYVVEDGLIEWLTVALLLGVVVVSLRRFVRLRAGRPRLFLACLLGFAGVFFFGAGEEISWGQRLLGFGTPEAIQQYNTQDEFTVHNLQFGEIRLNKLVFGLLLTIVVVAYVFVLPLVWRLWPPVRGLAAIFAVPVPRGFSAVIVVLLAPVVDFMPSQNRWELLELIVVSAVFLAVLRPLNDRIFRSDLS
ncbi:MAG: hypothetical protein WEC73_03225 [Chthoniobacterales bacterium]